MNPNPEPVEPDAAEAAAETATAEAVFAALVGPAPIDPYALYKQRQFAERHEAQRRLTRLRLARERPLRRRAAKWGLALRRSRARWGPAAGTYELRDAGTGAVVVQGPPVNRSRWRRKRDWNFGLSLDQVAAWLDAGEARHAQRRGTSPRPEPPGVPTVLAPIPVT